MWQSQFKSWVNREVDKKLDQEPFSSLPLKMRIGIFLLVGSFILSYGFPIVIFAISGFKQVASGLISSFIVYILSWVITGVGFFLAGKDSIKYPIYFLAKFMKMLFPKYFTE